MHRVFESTCRGDASNVLEAKKSSYFRIEEKVDLGGRSLFVSWDCLEWCTGAFLGCKVYIMPRLYISSFQTNFYVF